MLTTVAAVAMVAMVASGPARAGERRPYISFEVGGDFMAGKKQIWSQDGTTFDTDRIRPDVGLSGRVGYVTPFGNTPYDIGIFARFGATERDKDRANGGTPYNVLGGLAAGSYSVGRAKHREHHVIVDFEARRDFGFGSGDDGVRITAKGGLRFGYFDADTDTTFSTPGAFLAMEHRNSRFIGAGPRLGADAAVPIIGNLQLDLSAAGSLLLGDRQRRTKSKQPLGGITVGFNTDNKHSFRLLPMVEASAAVSFKPYGADVMTISLGFRGEAWFNVHDQRTKFRAGAAGGLGKNNVHRFNYGPFLRVKVPLGGG